MRSLAAGARGLAAALAVTAAACGGGAPPPANPAGPPPVPVHLEPACGLLPAAGLAWLVEVKPRALAQEPDLIPVIAAVVPEARFDAYAKGHGGIDLRQVQDLCVGQYKGGNLASAHVLFDPARVERAFDERATSPVKRTVVAPNPAIVRLEADLAGESTHVTLFGREHLALATGGVAPLRAAEAFALGKLRRASPALTAPDLARLTEILGVAPVRVFVPGPFEGEAAAGLGGLLRASTGVGVAARPAGGGRLALRLAVAGAFREDDSAAAERLAAAVHVLSESAFGRMLGLHRPVAGPTARATADALVLEATYDGRAAAEGAHDVLEADIGRLLRR